MQIRPWAERTMDWVDWSILAVLAVSVMGGIAQGLFRTVCSLVGLVLGLVIAVWNYQHMATVFTPIVRVEPIADAVGFLVIALLVMAIFNVLGMVLHKTFRWLGLGCVDALGGAVVGFLQGALLVMVCILVTVAFFPQTAWLTEARLPRYFFRACHVSADMSPDELRGKLGQDLKILEHESPEWMHPKNGVK